MNSIVFNMDLDKVWQWQKKKLSCRIRPEEGNPMGEGLREMLSELAGQSVLLNIVCFAPVLPLMII